MGYGFDWDWFGLGLVFMGLGWAGLGWDKDSLALSEHCSQGLPTGRSGGLAGRQTPDKWTSLNAETAQPERQGQATQARADTSF